MAIVSFWSGNKKETGQTLSIVAIATYMSIEHNYKTLIIDAALDDDTIERCFWKQSHTKNKEIKQMLNKGKLDIASGTEGLLSAIASNKTTPEIISNYTKVVFKNRLDILLGLKTKSISEHEKSMQLYIDLIRAANKFYDMVIVDLSKTDDRESTMQILKISDVIMYTMSQNLKQIDDYIENKSKVPELSKKNVIPILCNVDGHCKYNPKNVATYIKDRELAFVEHNSKYLEVASEGAVSDLFLSTIRSKKTFDNNARFLKSIGYSSKKIIAKFEELKYGKVSQT